MKQKNKNTKVAVGVSGGVDSSVALALLQKQGYDVVGVFIDFWKQAGETNSASSKQAKQDAEKVCQILNVPFKVVKIHSEFKKDIVDYFTNAYKQGKTPNPCVVCNRKIKFGEFFDKIKDLKVDYIATGHYALIKKTKSKGKTTFKLLKPKDKNKDQTYFLHGLNQAQLAKILFPLAKYTKPEIRQLAKKLHLPTFAKQESQEICFVENDNLAKFLKQELKFGSGEIREFKTEKVLGIHKGLPLYTIGQRKGIGLPGGPWYVVSLDTKKNILYVSLKEVDIQNKKLKLKEINWIAGIEPKLPLKATAKIRYRVKAEPAKIYKENDFYIVEFKRNQRAITPGQFCVFWQGKQCLGGGEIIE